MASFLSELQALFPPDRLYDDAPRLAPYASDGLTVFQETPLAVVVPVDREEVIEAVRLCYRHGVPFVARGSGTSLSGGSLPIKEGLVIGLNRLNRVLSIDPDSRVAVVEPGVINAHVSAEAARHGLYYAPDPSSQSVCTIGGNLAFNSGGAHCLKYGMTSNHVLGLTVALANGEVVELGNDSLENAGADCSGLFVGSEGLFGIAVEVKLRLLPIAEDCQTLLAGYDSVENAGDAVSAIVKSGLLPVAMEIMDKLAIEAAEAAVSAGYPGDAQAVMIVELDGEALDVGVQFAALMQIVATTNPTQMRVAKDAAERAVIWKGRKSAFSAVGRLSPDYLVQDGVVPRSKLGYALKEISRLGKESGLRVANVFHAGDGNLHPLILFDGKLKGELERAELLAGKILKLCLELGGSITGEHGIGVEKKAYMADMFAPETMDAFEGIRRSLDPKLISNRGKVFARRDSSFAPNRERYAKIRETIYGKKASLGSEKRRASDGPTGDSKAKLTFSRGQPAATEISAHDQIIEYLPDEYTITLEAGATLGFVQECLARAGQYLPFDPPGENSATIGSIIAKGLSGPGSHRFGLLRDFIIGVGFVDGIGRYVHAGGKVVKNAAGFDLPKLLVGSHGSLGAIVDASFKVFPKPAAFRTARFRFGSFNAALKKLTELGRSRFCLHALELTDSGELIARFSGEDSVLDARVELLAEAVNMRPVVIGRDEESAFWDDLANLRDLPSSGLLVKCPVAPRAIDALDGELATLGSARRYGVGGSVAWIQTDRPAEELAGLFSRLGLEGQVVRGESPAIVFGRRSQRAFFQRVKRSLDPDALFIDLY